MCIHCFLRYICTLAFRISWQFIESNVFTLHSSVQRGFVVLIHSWRFPTFWRNLYFWILILLEKNSHWFVMSSIFTLWLCIWFSKSSVSLSAFCVHTTLPGLHWICCWCCCWCWLHMVEKIVLFVKVVLKYYLYYPHRKLLSCVIIGKYFLTTRLKIPQRKPNNRKNFFHLWIWFWRRMMVYHIQMNCSRNYRYVFNSSVGLYS